jgi:type IV pilus assembly protein PilA
MKKKKVGFWRKIKNIYDYSPWHAAFTYPIAYIIIALVLFGIFLSIGNEYIGVFFYASILLIPIWVLIGLIISKRRLPYLLSLIIGLVIPAIIGVVAYNEFTRPAKVNATKTIHAQTVKYISAEIQKCKLGDSKFMNNNQDCPATASKAIIGAVATMTDVNPYDSSKLSIRTSNSITNDEDVGYISLSASGSDIIIKSCNKTPCNKKANRQSSTVSIK